MHQTPQPLKLAQDLMAFMDAGPTAYHAVLETRKRLDISGYQFLNEADKWTLKPGGKYYTTRGDSAIVAWTMGAQSPVKTGLRLIGAHTDSPGFRLKPNAVYTKAGYIQFGVEVYGSPLIASWTDRDLGLAGRVLVTEGGQLIARPVWIKQAVLRMPQLAIHLNRKVNDDGLVLDKQRHIPPIAALLNSPNVTDGKAVIETLLSEKLGIEPGHIISWELEPVDLQPARIGGLNNEFIFSRRIDNLALCHAALLALLNLTEAPLSTSMIAMFDNEEVGSNTRNGGASPFPRHVIERVLQSRASDNQATYRGLAKSFCISADGAHAVHPNYAEYHDAQHQVRINGGPVIKRNAQERYATDGDSEAVFSTLCREAEVPFQHYIQRTDLPCGSTIGPITAANLGIPVVDVGSAMLSMHSVRETCGAADPALMIRVLTRFFEKQDLWKI